MKKKIRIPKELLEKEKTNIPFEESFDDDYVPIDWEEWVKEEETLGYKVDPKFKKFLGMNEKNCVSEEEIKYN